MANCAIASLSYLASRYSQKDFKANSSEIANARALSKPLVAKVMSQMSTAGLVNGIPGPGGGFFLANPPEETTLLDIVKIFQRVENALSCPFGPGWCGNGEHCPLHSQLEEQTNSMIDWLSSTNLEVFQKHPTQPNRTEFRQWFTS